MNEMLKLQGSHGNWNYDPYMMGMYNGMEFMMAMIEDREPVFKEAPEVWLDDIPVPDNGVSSVKFEVIKGGLHER